MRTPLAIAITHPVSSDRTPRLISHIIVIALLALSGALISWMCSGQLVPHLLSERQNNVWFDADAPQRFDRMVSRWSADHTYIIEHPFFSLLTTPGIWLFSKLIGTPPLDVVRIALALASGVSAVVVYCIVLPITKSHSISVLWTLVYLASAGFVFWSGVPETFCFGMLSLLLPFLVCAYLQPSSRLNAWLSAAIVASLSVTVTNVMSGLAVAFVLKPLRDIVAIARTCIVVSAAMTFIQAQVIPATSAKSLFSMNVSAMILDKQRFMASEEQEPRWYRPYRVLLAGAVTPEVIVRDEPRGRGWATERGLTLQTTRYTTMGVVGAWIWIVLLVGAVSWGLFHWSSTDALYRSLVIVVMGQFLLHVVFGTETFLYSAHYGPVLILFSAYACRTRFRRIAVALAVALLVIEIANNVPAFLWSADYVRTLAAAG